MNIFAFLGKSIYLAYSLSVIYISKYIHLIAEALRIKGELLVAKGFDTFPIVKKTIMIMIFLDYFGISRVYLINCWFYYADILQNLEQVNTFNRLFSDTFSIVSDF